MRLHYPYKRFNTRMDSERGIMAIERGRLNIARAKRCGHDAYRYCIRILPVDLAVVLYYRWWAIICPNLCFR